MKKLNSISFISFTIFLVSIMYVDEFQTFLYRGGMFLFCLNAAVLIACVCHPVSILGRILAWKPLCWIGSRSYGIYLWHYPVMVLGTPIHEIGNPSYWRIALQLVLIVTIAECSYRFIEMPIRKEGFWAYYRKYFVFNKKKWGSLTFSRKVSTVMAPLFLLVFFTGITGVVGEGQQSSKDSYPTAIKINGDEPTANPIKEPDKTTDNPSPSKEEEVDVPDIETLKPEENETNVVPEKEDAYQNILAIGDSVMIDIATSLHKVFPNITIDGKIGRQVSQAVKLAPNYASFNQSNNAIIIQLGTNGYFTNDQIDTLLAAFANADIYLVNTRVPRSWEGKVNASLLQKSEEHENITLIDWHAAALNHPEYFAPDGVHLEKKGVEVLTNLIQQSINK